MHIPFSRREKCPYVTSSRKYRPTPLLTARESLPSVSSRNVYESTGSRIFLDPTRMQGNVSGFIYDSVLMQAAILLLRSEISPLP
ncbi:hypothetical protein ALC53_08469 [Atta colombica]|uniref:Uncharacterized protein n=1 Tax=Atta colombica TaxID=520822 RepID=A0A195B9B4_9HYME|nr:hypothetical protein ALC53_08469 [Atta colombica]